jgi:hypothetical protein
MVEEARLDTVASGLAPASDGWFVVNVADSPREAYASHAHWTLGRPEPWDALPWAARS